MTRACKKQPRNTAGSFLQACPRAEIISQGSLLPPLSLSDAGVSSSVWVQISYWLLSFTLCSGFSAVTFVLSLSFVQQHSASTDINNRMGHSQMKSVRTKCSISLLQPSPCLRAIYMKYTVPDSQLLDNSYGSCSIWYRKDGGKTLWNLKSNRGTRKHTSSPLYMISPNCLTGFYVLSIMQPNRLNSVISLQQFLCLFCLEAPCKSHQRLGGQPAVFIHHTAIWP